MKLPPAPKAIYSPIIQKKYITILLIICGFLFLFSWSVFGMKKPSNTRTWEFGFGTLPQVTIANDTVTIKNIRDYRYKNGKNVSSGYINRTVDINKLERAWFLVEPFEIKPFTGMKGGAHTYFTFDFQGQEPLVVSVEARREKDEKYNAFSGMFNQYELIYIWGSEKDITGRRATVEKNPIYMYPLTISKDSAKKLFFQIVQTTHELETKPRFYNSLTSNCTNELAKSANKVKHGAIPFTLAYFLPGYSDKKLHELGFIPNDKPYEEIMKKYFVSEIVKEHYDKNNFSEMLRKSIRENTN